jgi:hypothetical protein
MKILKSKVSSWSLPRITIDYCIIIINAYYIYIINSWPNYSVSNKGLLEECRKEENVEVTGTATTSYLKRRF